MPRHTLHDLASFSLTSWASVPEGRIFVDGAISQVKSRVNGHAVLVTLAKPGITSPIFLDVTNYSGSTRGVLLLPENLRISATPIGEGIALTEELDPSGCLVTLPTGIAVCGNFADDMGGKNGSGRVAINLQTGLCEFHYREMPWLWNDWTVAWRNAQGEVVYSLTSEK